MNFDYRFGTEATFNDWVKEGIAKAEAMLDSENASDKPEDTSDNKQTK